MKKHMLVMDTEPPCPRCDLMGKIIKELIKEKEEFTLTHCAFDSKEALDLGQKLNKKNGTAKYAAKEADVQLDLEKICDIIEKKKSEHGGQTEPADFWTKELDDILVPCQKAAPAVNYFMTPVLVAKDEVKFFSSVPNKDKLKQLLGL